MGKFILLALGGYVLYEYFYGAPQAATLATTTIPPLGTSAAQPKAVASTSLTSNDPAYWGLPNDVVQVVLLPGQGSLLGDNAAGKGGCNLTSPLYGGTSVPAAPYYSPSTKQYYCGPLSPDVSNTSTVVSPTSVAATSLVSASVQTQLQQLANGYLAANPNAGGLNVDQWNYYLAQITGIQISGAQAEQLILSLGETDATRGTIIPLSVYLTALNAVGLGQLGLGMLRGLSLIRNVA